MKYILLVVLICISSLANAQSSKQRLEDIEDKLDMMRAEQDYKDAQRRIEQQNRGSDITPLQRQLSISEYSKIFKNENVAIYIEDKSILKRGTNENPDIFYIFIFEFYKPNYLNDGKPYYFVKGAGSIYCKKNFVWINDYWFMDKNLKPIDRSGIQSFKTKGRLEEEIQKYLCR